MKNEKNPLIEPEMLVNKKLWTRKGKYVSQDELIQAYINQKVKGFQEKETDTQGNMDQIEHEVVNLLENPVLKNSLEDKKYQEIILGLLQESLTVGLLFPDKENSILERFSSGIVLTFIREQESESLDFSKALISLVNPREIASLEQLEKKWVKPKAVPKCDFSDFI